MTAADGRLAGKLAIVMGGGQTPGDTIGNGRATSVLFAREGATVVVVDRRGAAAEETVAQIRDEGGVAEAVEADATREADCAELFARCVAARQRAQEDQVVRLHRHLVASERAPVGIVPAGRQRCRPQRRQPRARQVLGEDLDAVAAVALVPDLDAEVELAVRGRLPDPHPLLRHARRDAVGEDARDWNPGDVFGADPAQPRRRVGVRP